MAFIVALDVAASEPFVASSVVEGSSYLASASSLGSLALAALLPITMSISTTLKLLLHFPQHHLLLLS